VRLPQTLLNVSKLVRLEPLINVLPKVVMLSLGNVVRQAMQHLGNNEVVVMIVGAMKRVMLVLLAERHRGNNEAVVRMVDVARVVILHLPPDPLQHLGNRLLLRILPLHLILATRLLDTPLVTRKQIWELLLGLLHPLV
jgi:hypothetical protein